MNFLQELSDLLPRLDESADRTSTVELNMATFKRIHGGLGLVRAHPMPFDPRQDYWRRPERRMLVAYLAKEWHRRFAPAAVLRQLALDWLRHFDRGREDGRFVTDGRLWSTVEYSLIGGWPEVAARLGEHASSFRDGEPFQQLRAAWPRVVAPNAVAHLEDFLQRSAEAESGIAALEPSFAARLPWFAFLDAHDLEELRHRQHFFYGFANLMTSTNAYRTAGAQTFAGLLQNTPFQDTLSQVERWTASEVPAQPLFTAISKDGDMHEDRSQYMPVVEQFGFVRLHRQPFVNKQTIAALRESIPGAPTDPYLLAGRVGEISRAHLRAHPDEIAVLAERFVVLAGSSKKPLTLEMEGLASSRAAARVGEDASARIDAALFESLERAALAHVETLSDLDRAAAMLHLMLDAEIYNQDEVVPEPVISPGLVKPGWDRLTLPPSLREAGEMALAYLHSGLHVLLAGAPGTGKTTLAQFIGAAWNAQSRDLPGIMDPDQLPLTTVASSGWSPFHTIGGLQPQADGSYATRPGIFIDPAASDDRDWWLRDGAIVLDEMNRADLDRAIGELYPLLSRSVPTVFPAGIPGVERIHLHERFRIIATVNDATLDDIVFPISEGLARRFQRIELPGAAEAEVLDYLHGGIGAGPKDELVDELIALLYSEAGALNRLRTLDEAERLNFGVGYFALLKRWVNGSLEMPDAFAARDLRSQAHAILAASLATLGRDHELQQLLDHVRDNF